MPKQRAYDIFSELLKAGVLTKATVIQVGCNQIEVVRNSSYPLSDGDMDYYSFGIRRSDFSPLLRYGRL